MDSDSNTNYLIIGGIILLVCCFILCLSGGGYYYYYSNLTPSPSPSPSILPTSTTSTRTTPTSTTSTRTTPTSTTPTSTTPTSTTSTSITPTIPVPSPTTNDPSDICYYYFDKYKIRPASANDSSNTSWGEADNKQDIKTYWINNNCNTKNVTKMCDYIKNINNIIPNVSWGNASNNEIDKHSWSILNCNTNISSEKPLDYTKWSSIKNRVNNESDEIFANRIYDTISGVQDRFGGRNFVRDNLKNVMTVDDNTAALFCTNPCYWYPETTIQQGFCGNCKKINPKWTGCTKSEQCIEGTSCLISNTTANNGRCLTKDDCENAAIENKTTGKCDTSL